MPNLFVMRHGDAASSAAGDRSRVLSPLGQAQALETGRLLAGLPEPPRQILCSAAPRALETARLVATALADSSASPLGGTAGSEELPFRAEDDLYLAPAQAMLEAAANALASNPADLLVVAHEPGCGELISLLCDGQPDLVSYPYRTAGVRRLELPSPGVLLPGSARLTLEL
ncbi:MAG: histidine phosphatase family protein [Planctomycetota bacterium]